VLSFPQENQFETPDLERTRDKSCVSIARLQNRILHSPEDALAPLFDNINIHISMLKTD